MIKAVLFDFNGTLIDDGAYHAKAWLQMYKEITGEECDLLTFERRFNGRNNQLIIDDMSNHTLSREENDRLSLHKEEIYRQFLVDDQVPLRAGVYELLDYLKENHIPFTIASASIKPNIDFFIENYHLADYMDPTTIVYDDHLHPTKASMYLDAAKRLNVNCEDCIIFEDSISGIKAGEEVHCDKLIVIENEVLAQEYKNHAIDYLSHDFHELLTYIKTL
ncbi:MAG: HAD family phosphatase [Erysipelotrichaceae bacterium]|nr:HAD family phosphatase [Erysipelotrichaceae bacterium]